MTVDGLLRRVAALQTRLSTFNLREGIPRPLRAVAQDPGFPSEFRLADPSLAANRVPLMDVLVSDTWSGVLSEDYKLSGASVEDLEKAVSATAEHQVNSFVIWCDWDDVQDELYKQVDNLVEMLVVERHFEFSVELLERCSELKIIRDASFANFLRLCSENGRGDIMISAALHWTRTGEKEFRGYSANTVAYHAFLTGDVDLCLYLLRTMHHYKIPFASDYPYSITIHACNTNRRWGNALEVYDLFKTTGLHQSHIIVRNVLHSMRETNLKERFEEFVDEWMHARRFHFEEFRAVMETCKRFNDLERAKAIFKMVRRERVNLDIRCINTLLSIYKDISVLPPLNDVFGFLERSGIRPDVFTFSLIFGCCLKTRQPIEVVDRVIDQVNQWSFYDRCWFSDTLMKCRNVKFNAVMLSSACMAYTRAESDSAEILVEKAISLLDATGVADQACYHAVMASCIELGHLEEALRLQDRMESAGFLSNDVTYAIMSQKCLNAGFSDYAFSFKDRREAYLKQSKQTDMSEAM